MTSDTSAERRKHRRVSTTLAVTYRSTTLTVDGNVANISQGGLFLMATARDPVGTEAQLTIELPDLHHPLVIQGMVSWICTEDSGMGIAFRTLARNSRLALANYLLVSNNRS